MRVSNFHFEVSRHYRNYAEWKTVLEIEIIKTQEIFRQFQDKRTGEPAKKRFSSQSENAARGKSNFPEMAKCHLSTKPFFVRGKTPFVRPAHFLSVAKRHSPASSFSVRGKTPFARQLIFCPWQNATRRPTYFLPMAKYFQMQNFCFRFANPEFNFAGKMPKIKQPLIFNF